MHSSNGPYHWSVWTPCPVQRPSSRAMHRPRQRPSRLAINASRSNRCTSCSFFRSAPCRGGISFFGSRSRKVSGPISSTIKQLQPVQQFGGGGLLLQARHVTDFVEQLQRLRHQPLLDAGKMHVDDRAHGVAVGKPDVVEEAAAQERVRQFLLVVGGDDHDRPLPRRNRLAGFVDEEFHPIELLQEIVGKFDIGLVDLVDQQHRALVGREGVPQFAALDVVADVLDALVAELAVAQPRYRVIFVQALLRLGGRLDVPFHQRCADRAGDFVRQHGLAGAGLALHQQRPLAA